MNDKFLLPMRQGPVRIALNVLKEVSWLGAQSQGRGGGECQNLGSVNSFEGKQGGQLTLN